MVGARRLRQSAQPIRRRERRRLAKPNQLGNRRHLALDEHAGGIAIGILLNSHGVDRRYRVAGDAGAPERLGVGARHERKGAAPVTPDGANEDRIVRRRRVEFLPRRPALLGEDLGQVEIIGWIADRHGDDPFARLLGAGQFGDAVLDVADRANASERGKHVAQGLAVHMGVAVGDAGNDRFALEIKDARRRTAQSRHRGVRPDRQDPVAGNGDCLRHRGCGIDGDDLPVGENEIGRSGCGLRRYLGRRRRARRVRQSARQHAGGAGSTRRFQEHTARLVHRDRSVQEKSAIECGGLSYFLPKYVLISSR
jgi:hypothetical protein